MEISLRTPTAAPACALPFLPDRFTRIAAKNNSLQPSAFLPTSLFQSADNANHEGQSQNESGVPKAKTSDFGGPRLIPLRYRNQEFPDGIEPAMAKVPAHFDVVGLKASGPYSLHTEYSSKSRKLMSTLVEGLETIKTSHRRMVPEQWISKAWALEFAEFIFRLVGQTEPPSMIEIHPPFTSSMPTAEAFLDVYEIFETAILTRFPECMFAIENRSGTKHPYPFLVSDADSILALGQALASRDLKLTLALDLPQMFTTHFGSKQPVGLEGAALLKSLLPIRDQIHTLHLWGRGPSGGAHNGSLDDLFDQATGAKQACLAELAEMICGGKDRYLVVEVTRNVDLRSILTDLKEAGFRIA